MARGLGFCGDVQNNLPHFSPCNSDNVHIKLASSVSFQCVTLGWGFVGGRGVDKRGMHYTSHNVGWNHGQSNQPTNAPMQPDVLTMGQGWLDMQNCVYSPFVTAVKALEIEYLWVWSLRGLKQEWRNIGEVAVAHGAALGGVKFPQIGRPLFAGGNSTLWLIVALMQGLHAGKPAKGSCCLPRNQSQPHLVLWYSVLYLGTGLQLNIADICDLVRYPAYCSSSVTLLGHLMHFTLAALHILKGVMHSAWAIEWVGWAQYPPPYRLRVLLWTQALQLRNHVSPTACHR